MQILPKNTDIQSCAFVENREFFDLQRNDYYPFGMLMPERKYSASQAYRYGFNGKEMDNEIKGEGNSYDYGARLYDPRIGRWFSPDKKYKAAWSPYSSFYNNPNIVIDPDGNNEIVIIDKVNRTITIYHPVLYNKNQDAILAKVENATTKDLEIAANKRWDQYEHKTMMVDVGNGKMEEYAISFKLDIIEAKDDNEYRSLESEFAKRGIAYSAMDLKENYGQSDYNSWSTGVKAQLNLNTSTNGKADKLENTVTYFVHEALGHGSGLSHSQSVMMDITLPNGSKGKAIDPSKSGISSYAPINSFQPWEVNAIMNAITKGVGNIGKLKDVSYFNIIADGMNEIRHDALQSLSPLKKPDQQNFIQDRIKQFDKDQADAKQPEKKSNNP